MPPPGPASLAELYLIRHGQASFGAADYDRLSPLGHDQSRALGRALGARGVAPDAFYMGDMLRHRQTLEGILGGMGAEATPTIHTGLNEFDFTDLLDARYKGQKAPENMHTERKSHFRTLRDTVLEWEAGGIAGAKESWAQFSTRIEAARAAIMNPDHDTVIAVSSGGAIARMIAALLDCGPGQQIKLQLQIKNCSVTRFIFSARGAYLHSFNETPHIDGDDSQHLLTYS